MTEVGFLLRGGSSVPVIYGIHGVMSISQRLKTWAILSAGGRPR